MECRRIKLAARLFLLAMLMLTPFISAGCTTNRATVYLKSMNDSSRILSPHWKVVAARITDTNNVDIFMSDRALNELEKTDFSKINKDIEICHVRMFIAPRAGHTPIQSTACNTIINFIILTPGAAGEYSGAGFMIPELSSDYRHFRGSLIDGRTNLIRKTGTFQDLLGTGSPEGTIEAVNDPAMVRRFELVMEKLRYKIFPEKD